MNKKQKVLFIAVCLIVIIVTGYGIYSLKKKLYTGSLEKRVDKVENEIKALNEKLERLEKENGRNWYIGNRQSRNFVKTV